MVKPAMKKKTLPKKINESHHCLVPSVLASLEHCEELGRSAKFYSFKSNIRTQVKEVNEYLDEGDAISLLL